MSHMALLMLKAQAELEEKKQRTLKVILGNGLDLDAVYSFRRLVLWYGGGDGSMPNPKEWVVEEAVRQFGKHFVARSKTPEDELDFKFSQVLSAEGGPQVQEEIIFDRFEGPGGLAELLDYQRFIVCIANERYSLSTVETGLPTGTARFDRDAIIRTALIWWDAQLVNKGLLP